uniref:TLC domain-containing protein n=1 Tax=Mesocestoides corti TaxID=53468 RepID=A0A5K3EH09_MESCO
MLTTVASSVHATLVTLLSLESLLFDQFQWADPITSISRTGCIALAITIGYMFADTITMFTFQKGLELILFSIHHLLVAVCFTFLLVYRLVPVYGIMRLVSEVSTPFLNQRWFFRTIGGDGSKERSARVTLVFAGLFIIGRYILPIPYWIVFWSNFNSRPHLLIKADLPPFTNYFISCPVLLDILNIAWGYPVFMVTRKALITLGYIHPKAEAKQNGFARPREE